jgi:hypothetical protein
MKERKNKEGEGPAGGFVAGGRTPSPLSFPLPPSPRDAHRHDMA